MGWKVGFCQTDKETKWMIKGGIDGSNDERIGWVMERKDGVVNRTLSKLLYYINNYSMFANLHEPIGAYIRFNLMKPNFTYLYR